ncbi:hypothetical protein V5O48_019110, partial [Marasmius crinis-equi]
MEQSPDFEWTSVGFINPSPHIEECARTQRLPDILPFIGNSRGNQLPPSTPQLAERLITKAHSDGNLKHLVRLRDAMGLAQVLTTLKPHLRVNSLELPGSFETLLVANPHPLWAAFTRFTRYESTVRPSDSIANWLEGESPSKVPSVRTPGNRSTDE